MRQNIDPAIENQRLRLHVRRLDLEMRQSKPIIEIKKITDPEKLKAAKLRSAELRRKAFATAKDAAIQAGTALTRYNAVTHGILSKATVFTLGRSRRI